QLAADSTGRVDLDRALSLVQPSPVQAPTIAVERQAAHVRRPSHRIDAYDVGAQLSQSHPSRWSRHVRRHVQDPQAYEGPSHTVNHALTHPLRTYTGRHHTRLFIGYRGRRKGWHQDGI